MIKNENKTSIKTDAQKEQNKSFQISKVMLNLRRGIYELIRSRIKGAIFIIVVAICCIGWIDRQTILSEQMHFLSEDGIGYLTFILITMIVLFTLWVLGASMPGARTDESFLKINHVNSLQEPPRLLWYKSQNGLQHFCFRANNVPKSLWEDRRELIESAMNVKIVGIEEYQDNQRIIVTGVPAKRKLPDMLPWNNDYLHDEDFVISLGQSLIGEVLLDLSKTAHSLIAGSTGSGKSVLVRSILNQCLKKGAQIVMVDMKGGADYASVKSHIDIITDSGCLLERLETVVGLLKKRQASFVESGCANIQAFNARHGSNMKRIIVVIDETAEVLDVKSALTKEEKEEVNAILRHLKTIARTGRSAGIHLILCTQRPDVNVLDGQIRDNIDSRICGYVSDHTLASMILGGADDAVAKALHEITAHNRGRFVTKDGQLFQSYYIE